MNERDMQGLEEILDVERPVRIDHVVAAAHSVGTQLSQRQPGQAPGDIMYKRFQRGDRVERDESMIGPGGKWNLRQVVGRRGEVLRLRELRHEGHAPGEIKAPG